MKISKISQLGMFAGITALSALLTASPVRAITPIAENSCPNTACIDTEQTCHFSDGCDCAFDYAGRCLGNAGCDIT